MAEVAEAPTVVVDTPEPASPVEGESPPAAELGANEASPEATPSKADEAYRKLQSEADKARAALKRAEERAAKAEERALELVKERTSARTREQIDAEIQKLPDPLMYPREHADGMRALVYRVQEYEAEQQAKLERTAARVAESKKYIADYLGWIKKERGVEIDPNDERLLLMPGGKAEMEAFRKSANLIADQAVALRKAAEAEARAAERLKEAGVDRFDGGSGAGGAEAGLTFEKWSRMSWAERQDYRANKREQVQEMERRYASGRR